MDSVSNLENPHSPKFVHYEIGPPVIFLLKLGSSLWFYKFVT